MKNSMINYAVKSARSCIIFLATTFLFGLHSGCSGVKLAGVKPAGVLPHDAVHEPSTIKRPLPHVGPYVESFKIESSKVGIVESHQVMLIIKAKPEGQYVTYWGGRIEPVSGVSRPAPDTSRSRDEELLPGDIKLPPPDDASRKPDHGTVPAMPITNTITQATHFWASEKAGSWPNATWHPLTDSTLYPFTLSEGARKKTVFVRLKDANGKMSPIVHDSVILQLP